MKPNPHSFIITEKPKQYLKQEGGGMVENNNCTKAYKKNNYN